MININTKKYWDDRFAQNWEKRNGRVQTQRFAEAQIPYLDLPPDFNGTILDFGCGLGDAIPLYKKSFPKAKLIGVDISSIAINKCREKFGDIAEFICGSAKEIQFVDVIISSNVFEHLSDDTQVLKNICLKANIIYIIVPYREHPLSVEHVNTYDEYYFDELKPKWFKIFLSKGWTEYGVRLIKLIVLNGIRIIKGKKPKKRSKQIIFCFDGSKKH